MIMTRAVATRHTGTRAVGIRRGEDDWTFGQSDDVELTRSTRIIWALCAFVAAMFVWAWFATLDEVATGTGKVVPSTQEQVIQSLEGGILARINVHQDDVVQPGQILAQLDPTLTASNVEENAAKYRAALAREARLQAEVNQTPLRFPKELDSDPGLIAKETALYAERRHGLNESLGWIRESIRLLQKELATNQSLVAVGASSAVEVLRLQQKLADLELQQANTTSQYYVQAHDDLTKASADVATLSAAVKGRSDALARLTQRSPVRGIVKNIEVSTIGGVIPPNGKLMEIVPLDDRLLIETRIEPRDIAFIRPGQPAKVKITAYDSAIYGELDGKVSSISPDTIQDEAHPEVHYYRVYVRTTTNSLVNKQGRRFAIAPGMIANVDVHTGQKTVLEYLLKPLNKAREAMRER
jgi:membrane fusion protein, adhesin transport system